ncbi:DMT family transporter [Cyanobacterium stanieri LEGE 03274]|uniref:DMT family transporter n=1 Tax=Cyanobacterium stanieri LEGE 03274 TaxID=1828756 RepID=A0ABR9V4S8_9CHRO|nr:DMT family transporter [Cyanobacterium stanieri]MBE9222883.1 DMT family transporter [Cyanobacterium stanieri LEGE 03274]
MEAQKNINSSFWNPIIYVAPFFLWGTAMVAMKGIILETTPIFLGALRIFPAGILVLMFVGRGKSVQPQSLKAWGWIFLFALVDGAMFQGFLAEGLLRTGAGLGSVMIDSQPLLVAILCRWLFKDMIGFWGWLGLGVGIMGISLIGLPDDWIMSLVEGNWGAFYFSWEGLFNNGEWLMLLASLSMALGTVMIPYIGRHVDTVLATGWHMVIGGLMLFILSGVTETNQWVNISFSGWLSISYATIFGSAIAYGVFFYLASKGNITSLSALTFLTPVFALTFGGLILGEKLSFLQWGGVSLTLVSIYLINQRTLINQKWQNLKSNFPWLNVNEKIN